MSERRQGPPPRGVMVPGAAKGTGKSFVRLLSYMKRYWMQLILVFVCILVSAVAGVAGSTFQCGVLLLIHRMLWKSSLEIL